MLMLQGKLWTTQRSKFKATCDSVVTSCFVYSISVAEGSFYKWTNCPKMYLYCAIIHEAKSPNIRAAWR